MDAHEWFSRLIKKYRDVVEKDYFDIKEEFPFYSPTDIDVVLIEDPKNYFPEIMAFFNSGYAEEFPASDIITVQKKKIEWKKDLESLGKFEKRAEFDTKWHETFYDITRLPGIIAQESFENEILDVNPDRVAVSFVYKHYIRNKQKENLMNFFEISKFRIGSMGTDKVNSLVQSFSNFKQMNDLDKSEKISKTFWLMGFEVLNIEEMIEYPEYSQLKQIPHYDVIAVIHSQKILVAIDEGEMKKERWYKLSCLESNLKELKFLGTEEDWKVIFLAIGRKSKGILYLKGEVQVISLDLFTKTFELFIKRQSWFSLLSAIRNILGYNLNFFKYK